MSKKCLYIFLDEAGNFDFSPKGTRYFLLSSIAKKRPFHAYQELTELKYDLVELGMDIEYFHAAEDTQAVRNQVFDIIQRHLKGVRVDSLVVEKRKVAPSLREVERFYPEMLGYLLRYVLQGHRLEQYAEVIVFTDRIPINKKRKAVEKAMKMTLAKMLPKTARYRILHHDSKSNFDLQIADYCNWAIYRKWDSGDQRSYRLIKPVIQSEFDIFHRGTTIWY
ncbi:MAG: DUF3800 domain-containing protein [Anaerolineales bacterium]|nr:DUF3800 domain-containing protein [Anaerolineales bacterium]